MLAHPVQGGGSHAITPAGKSSGRQTMADSLSSHALSELIGSIYDCTLDPALWDQTLAEVRDALCCHTAVLHLNDLRHDRFLISKSVGIEPYWMTQLEKHLPEIGTRLTEDLASWPSLDEPYVIS